MTLTPPRLKNDCFALPPGVDWTPVDEALARLRDDLRAELAAGTRKVLAWTDKHGTAFADFPSGEFDPFFNVNTPEDLAQAQAVVS